MNIQSVSPLGAAVELSAEELALLREVCAAGAGRLLEKGDGSCEDNFWWLACEALAGGFQALGLAVEGAQAEKTLEGVFRNYSLVEKSS